MSAFLGNIHYWLYGKIQYLQKINEELLKSPSLDQTKYMANIPYHLPLEKVIDLNHIHDSLNHLIEDVENRHASILKELLTDQTEDEIKRTYYQLGQKESQHFDHVAQAFEGINRYLLDGMPCDQGIDIIIQEDDQILFEYDPFVHSSIIPFYQIQSLRNAWIEGFLSQSKLTLVPLSDTQYRLIMEE